MVQITGSAVATGNKLLFKQVSNWASRTSGNNIIDVEFDMFTGGATTSKNTARVYVYNSDGSTALASLMFNLQTKAISGIAYYDPNNGGANPVNTYSFNLGDTTNPVVTLSPNSWVRLGMSYNTVTREVIWKGPGFYAGVNGAVPATGTTSPGLINYIHVAGATNAVSAISKFDNLSAKAVLTETLLGTSNFQALKSNVINVYPNPATTVLNISNENNLEITAMSVTDINGRVVRNQKGSDTQIDVQDLNAGVYFLTIESTEGMTTKKFVKQ